MYEMQPIYMNATTCKMFLPTWLKINKFFKTNMNWILLIQITKYNTNNLQEEDSS